MKRGLSFHTSNLGVEQVNTKLLLRHFQFNTFFVICQRIHAHFPHCLNFFIDFYEKIMRQPKRKRNAGAPTFRNSIKSKFRKSKFRKIEVSKSNKSKRLHFDKAECFGGVNLLRSLPLVRPSGSAFEVLSKAQSQKLKLQVPQKYADCFCFQSIRGVSPQINVGGYVHWTAIISFVLRVR